MRVDIKLDSDFSKKFDQLKEKYGEEFLNINGFSKGNLNLSGFIDNFIVADTVADVSVDGNANVGNKDMRTLMNEYFLRCKPCNPPQSAFHR